MRSQRARVERSRVLGTAVVLAGLALGGCAGEEQIKERGWREAIECVEFRRSHKDCREPLRSDAPYVFGWERAIACMEQGRNLSACRKPQLTE